jgi:TldD protein
LRGEFFGCRTLLDGFVSDPEEISEYAVELAMKLGAAYADVRTENSRNETILVKDGKVEKATSELQRGMGIRVLFGTWGFASTTELVKPAVGRAVKTAVSMAKAVKGSAGVKMAEFRVAEARTQAGWKIDPFEVDLSEKIDICLEADQRARVDGHIKRTSATVAAQKLQKLFLSSEGARIRSDSLITYAGVFALAKRGAVTEYFEDLAGGTGGFEIAQRFDMPARAGDVGKRALALASAKAMPRRRLPVVMDPDFVALLVHEIIGHPSEADRVLGREAAWAGRAWWAGMVGRRIGSKLLNAVDDPRVEGALGYYEYDDEGVPARRKQLIREGKLLEHMHSRETAAEFKVEPNGNMRAQSFKYLPLIRMSNTFIEPGEHELEELFEVKEGVYLRGAKIPSIDSRRYNFQISAKEAFLIRRGELIGPFRDASIMGNAPEFFSSIDAVGRDFEMRPIINCGKGDPMQTLHVGNGGPHLRALALVAGVG